MKNTQVLLRETVKDLGKVGDVVMVRTGFARNYLVPRGLAVEASHDNIEMMKRRRARYDAEEQVRQAQVDARVAALAEVMVKTTEKADEGGHLYGSVNAAAVARLLTSAGHPTDERDVRLSEPIKTVGTHSVLIHVHGDSMGAITVVVEPSAG
jgi:large subunit ribosomal protein L9